MRRCRVCVLVGCCRTSWLSAGCLSSQDSASRAVQVCGAAVESQRVDRQGLVYFIPALSAG